MNVYCDPVCTVDDVCSVDVLRILTLGYDRGFLSTSRSSMVSVQNYLCKENRFRVRIFGLHLAQIGQLYNLYNTGQAPLITSGNFKKHQDRRTDGRTKRIIEEIFKTGSFINIERYSKN